MFVPLSQPIKGPPAVSPSSHWSSQRVLDSSNVFSSYLFGGACSVLSELFHGFLGTATLFMSPRIVFLVTACSQTQRFFYPALFAGPYSVSPYSCYVLESSQRVIEIPGMCFRGSAVFRGAASFRECSRSVSCNSPQRVPLYFRTLLRVLLLLFLKKFKRSHTHWITSLRNRKI